MCLLEELLRLLSILHFPWYTLIHAHHAPLCFTRPAPASNVGKAFPALHCIALHCIALMRHAIQGCRVSPKSHGL